MTSKNIPLFGRGGAENNDILVVFEKEFLSLWDVYWNIYQWNNIIANICLERFPLLRGREEADGE